MLRDELMEGWTVGRRPEDDGEARVGLIGSLATRACEAHDGTLSPWIVCRGLCRRDEDVGIRGGDVMCDELELK